MSSSSLFLTFLTAPYFIRKAPQKLLQEKGQWDQEFSWPLEEIFRVLNRDFR